MGKSLVLIFFTILMLCMNASDISANDSPSNLYVVKSGDTLPEIAKHYDTSTEFLKLTNGLLHTDTLNVGQKLLVPIKYEVTHGDNLKDLALAFHSTVDSIKTINGLTTDQIFPGQILKITPKKLTMQGQYILMTREDFKTWVLNNSFNRKITLIQQHHTWQPSYKHFKGNNHFQMLKGMETHHKKKMGWSNIAQNLTIFPDGMVAVSRPFNIAPEGSIGPKANATGLAIENIGNFDIGHDVMTKEQKDTIVYVTALLCHKFGLTPSIDTITYHHWWHYKTKERVLDNPKSYEVKSCPGTNFFGGNSTTSAKNNFYPLVTNKMKEM
jgi:LysM repeat protein